uniref:NECAP PHear domain-containing protein n=1 Tax=Strigamia maritima TaxID=126957 RepID=T1JKH1_STRMM
MEDYENILLIKPEVFVFRIPPRTTNRGYKAADWNLQTPDWTGRMRLVCKGNEVVMKLEDKTTGELFALCPVDKYPGIAIEAVADSSRYFVLRIQDDGRSAFIGFGFADRGDSFDLNVALQDHFKWVEKTEKIQEEEKDDTKPRLDLSFKEGQTIKINMNIGQKSSTNRPKPKASTGGGFGILPPPPGSSIKIAPPSAKNTFPVDSGSAMQTDDVHLPKASGTSSADMLLELGSLGSAPPPVQDKPNDLWNDFATAGSANTDTSHTARFY